MTETALNRKRVSRETLLNRRRLRTEVLRIATISKSKLLLTK